MPDPDHHPAWRELTLLAFSPREGATGPTRPIDRAGLPGTLPFPCRPRRPVAPRRRPHLVSPPPPAARDARRFHLLAPLGAGGMGTVYEAFDPLLERTVAVKLLRRHGAAEARRLLAEARLLARVEHPNVCRIYEAGGLGERPYIVMQRIRGPCLADAQRQMNRREKMQVVLGVVAGLGAVHRLGLLHRDVKPRNVVVERTPEGTWHPYLVDFGIAREVAAERPAGRRYLLGTPAYVAPEQVRANAPADHRADLYSAGAMLYELMCGPPPFGEGSGAVERLLRDEPVPPRRLVPDLPAALERVILRCLEKDPDRRYLTAADLGVALQGVLGSGLHHG